MLARGVGMVTSTVCPEAASTLGEVTTSVAVSLGNSFMIATLYEVFLARTRCRIRAWTPAGASPGRALPSPRRLLLFPAEVAHPGRITRDHSETDALFQTMRV